MLVTSDKATVLFTVITLHWATSLDSQASSDGETPSKPPKSASVRASHTTSQAPSSIADFDRIILNHVDFSKPGTTDPTDSVQAQETKGDVVDLEKGEIDIVQGKESRHDSQV